ncbi:MAG: peptidylprolyl isomerase [Syntrophobacteraceae bacterium]|jgi:peptidylprolyl isomerase|nr:peptidylprolyl isomerase [Syntrophobacteraceae bacterium]
MRGVTRPARIMNETSDDNGLEVGMGTPARQGDTVKVHYTGTLVDGTEFDSSRERAPLEFTIGAGQLIAGFERTVVGMTPGESRTTTIEAADAYGMYREDLVLEVERDRFPPDLTPEVGLQLEVRRPDGHTQMFMITDTSEAKVTLDANHPLAGHDLVFQIQLVEIV